MSASEKLRALERVNWSDDPVADDVLRNALPLIADCIEAAEAEVRKRDEPWNKPWEAIGRPGSQMPELAAALIALSEHLEGQ